MANPKITKIEIVIFDYEIQDMGTDYNGFNIVYEKGNVHKDGDLGSAGSYRYRGHR